MEQLLHPQEVADRLQIPPRTLGQWAYLGKGPAYVKVGKHRRYRPEDLEAWITAQRHGGDAS